MKAQELVKLSKLMSLALRHNPAVLNLKLDEEGWTPVAELVAAIRSQPRWEEVRLEDIEQVVESSDKQRFEVKEGLIRARYGHSRAARPVYQAVEPPAILYHGTTRRNLGAIRRQGLQAMARQYVHLSARPEMALEVGRRRDGKPVLLRIRAGEAHAAGIVFGTPSGGADNVYLVERMPADFIEFPEELGDLPA